jgi:hypothetical protein
MNELQTQDAPTANVGAMMFNPGAMNSLLAFADMMAKSSVTVPDHLKGKPADCMAIAMQAMQWGMNPFAVAQKTHIVSGRLGYEAQLVNAVVQQSNAIRGAFSYEFQGTGDALECRVGAVLRGESDVTWGEWLRCGSVTTKNSPLWKVNPKQQLGYLQVKNWARLYAPGAILGVYTPDELESVAPPPANKNMGPADVVQPPAKPALPDYSAGDFTKNLPAWSKVVEGGKKTGAELLAMLSTKATFNEQQKAAILSLRAQPVEPVEAAAPEVDAETGEFAEAYEAAEGAQQ